MASPLTYIVHAASWSENNGGAIFQHELVRTLREMGEEAWLWPMKSVYRPGLWMRFKEHFRLRPFHTAPGLENAVARRRHLRRDNVVVVYAELIRGNPLKAKNVVRWLLYPPGKLHPYEFGPDEMFFRVGELCDLPEVTGGAPDLLLWKVNPAYRNENRPDRKGTCYMVRKGHAKPRIPETEAPDAIRVDGMSHAELNEMFNRCERFISYDEATMYSQYAALCGCDSIVIPGMYPSRKEWSGEHELARYGVAYGMDDLDHARATRHKVEGLLRAEEEKGRETVRNFVALTRDRFGAHP